MDTERYRELFFQESSELLQRLSQSLVALAQSPHDEFELREIYRIMHSLKSMAATMDYEQTADLAHALESVLDRALHGTVPLTDELMDLLFKAADQFDRLTSGGEDGGQRDQETEALLQEIAHMAEGSLPAPASRDGEVVAPRASPAAGAPRRRITTLRIDVKRLDELINLAGELLIIKSRLRTLSAALDAPALKETLDQLERVSERLQGEALQARMLPLGPIFDRFARVVRDLAREAGKEVGLVTNGHGIELDRMILEDIGEPLLHLLRNAVSHGIESPQVRARLGKVTQGTITLSASREADRVVLEVRDDGQGIDPEEVCAVAVSKGFMAAEQAQALSPQDLMGLILLPGFSTATAVTEVSGRGVGLNVVKTRLEALKGSIEVKSARHEGCRFILRLPPPLAIVEALLVRVREEMFAIPMADVAVVLAINRADFETRNILIVRGQAVPLVDLARLLALPQATVRVGPAFVLIATLAGEMTGCIVDQVAGRQEIVLKPVEGLLHQVPGLSGATILGDGRVVLILDLYALLREEAERLAPRRR